MTEKAREMRKAYKRKWAAEHRDKCRQYQETYWNKKAAQAAAEEEAEERGQQNDI